MDGRNGSPELAPSVWCSCSNEYILPSASVPKAQRPRDARKVSADGTFGNEGSAYD